MNTRLASYSILYGPRKRASARDIKTQYRKGLQFDLEIVGMGPDAGRYVTPQELKDQGYKSVQIRFNQDRDVMVLPL